MNDLKPKNASDSGIFAPRLRGERRKAQRSVPAASYLTHFTIDGVAVVARLTEVSKSGACFAVEDGVNNVSLDKGRVLDLTIKSPWEDFLRKGRVTWERRTEKTHLFGVEYVDLPKDAECVGLLNMDKVKIDPAWALRIPTGLAIRRQVLPFSHHDGHVYVACGGPPDQSTLHVIEKMVAAPIRIEPAEQESLKRALDRVYSDLSSSAGKPRSIDVRSLAELQPEDAIAACDELMHAAILRQASDIHLDPEPDGLQIRLRVDGNLDRYLRLPAPLQSGVLNRFKVLSGMDIAEKRAPQDGGFKHRYGRTGQTIDIRVATLPTKYGERMTLRLLALQTESLTLERLGMVEKDLRLFGRYLEQPHGMILLSGPTGSGKTTTLYAAIRRLMEMEDLNILTVEDPIEYEIRGVAQIEVDSADKVTFLKALRSVLRHDPDVVMVGEIRDAETADVAIKASLTGHLVFSTLHTNSALSVITRMVDMGVDRFLIAATLRLAVAQRLVRQLCPRCRKPRELTAPEAAALGDPELTGKRVFEPGGCIYCAGKGYSGRIGLFEMLPLDEEWSRLIARGVEEAELLQHMRHQKIATLMQDGLSKLLAGTTSIREVLGAVTNW